MVVTGGVSFDFQAVYCKFTLTDVSLKDKCFLLLLVSRLSVCVCVVVCDVVCDNGSITIMLCKLLGNECNPRLLIIQRLLLQRCCYRAVNKEGRSDAKQARCISFPSDDYEVKL